MSNGTLPVEDLHAYVDRELAAARASAVAARLAQDPEAAGAVRVFAAQKTLLHAAFDDVLDEPVPARLTAARPGAGGRRAAGIAFACFVLGAAGGWGLRSVMQPEPVVLPRQAAIAHAAFIREVRHPVEVAANEEAHLVGWLSKRLGAQVRPPRLSALGYELLGGRLLPEAERPGAQFMYEDRAGRRLTIYVSPGPASGDGAFRYSNERGVHVFYWRDRDLGYALSGDLDKEEMQRVARAVYERLMAARAG